jgi:hypothetical protein
VRDARDLTLEHPSVGAIFEWPEDIFRRSTVRGCQSHGTGKLWLSHDCCCLRKERRVGDSWIVYFDRRGSTDNPKPRDLYQSNCEVDKLVMFQPQDVNYLALRRDEKLHMKLDLPAFQWGVLKSISHVILLPWSRSQGFLSSNFLIICHLYESYLTILISIFLLSYESKSPGSYFHLSFLTLAVYSIIHQTQEVRGMHAILQCSPIASMVTQRYAWASGSLMCREKFQNIQLLSFLWLISD